MPDDDVVLVVPQHELQLRQLGAQLVPVPEGHLAVAHERGHRVLDLAGARGEIRPLGIRERAHGATPRPGSGRARSPRGRSGPRAARRRRGAASRPRRSACPRSPSRGGRCPAGSGTRRPARDLDRLELAADLAELERRAALLHEPRLVLHLVVLEAERLAGADEEQLADVGVGLGPDELVAPRLLDAPRRDRVAADPLERSREPLRVRRHVLVGAAELLRRVDRQPHARVAERAQRALRGELRERRRLVVALLREAARAPPRRARRSRS